MNLLQKVLLCFTKRRIKRKCETQIQSWLAEVKCFKEIEIDEAFCAKIGQLCERNDFEALTSSFEEALERVRAHNQKVAKLKAAFEKCLALYSVQKISADFENFNREKLRVIHRCTAQIAAFELPSDFPKRNLYQNYAEQIGELLCHYDSALETFRRVKKLNTTLQNLIGRDYLDQKSANSLLAKVQKVIETCKFKRPWFCTFPLPDDIFISRNNETFIKAHLNDEIFENVNGNTLDEEQRRAILADPKANLVVAGAGAGKTLTICGKLKWLVETRRAGSDEILLLSYGRDSAKDLADKVGRLNLIFQDFKVKTFHALGKEILEAVSGKRQTVDEQFNSHIANFFTEYLAENQEAASDVFTFFSLYERPNRHAFKHYETEGEKFEDLKAADFRTLKIRLQNMRNPKSSETIKEEIVKSYEELVIANFLFVNGVRYEYERAYEVDTTSPDYRQYTPDFYLTDYGIYLEHYGVNKEGHTPQYSPAEEEAYLAGMQWKRKIHEVHHTTCLETYSYQFSDGTIFESLKLQLEEHGVKIKPLKPDTISRALHNLLGEEENLRDFTAFKKLLGTFLSHYKANYTDSRGFGKLKLPTDSWYERNRAELFLKIAKAAYEHYEAKLRSEGKIDFDDMILQATSALDKLQGYRYKYIMVDEFQDISRSRAKFLRKLLEHGDSKLFAVGDDWQAIYRFAGSDVNLFLNFTRNFEDAKIHYVTATHRNSAELATIAAHFITLNPAQSKREIRSNLHEENPVKILYHDGNRAQAFKKALEEIQRLKPSAAVLVLGRNNHELSDIRKVKQQTSQLKLTYKTVHGSKGLESDFVILLSGDDARDGFPNKMEDDEILEMVLDEADAYEFAEERRLFYVALTRTRSLVYILANKERPSSFVREIEPKAKTREHQKTQPRKVRTCPWCKSGKLKLREKDCSKFYGCSNYPYCKYKLKELYAVEKNNLCPHCGDFLVSRVGKNGSRFLGCHGFPGCKFTKNLR